MTIAKSPTDIEQDLHDLSDGLGAVHRTKKCGKCGEEKQHSMFGTRTDRKTLRSVCKSCAVKTSVEWGKTPDGKEKRRKKAIESDKKRRIYLTDSIVARRIGLSVKDVPKTLIELSREYLMNRRVIRDINKTLKEIKNGN